MTSLSPNVSHDLRRFVESAKTFVLRSISDPDGDSVTDSRIGDVKTIERPPMGFNQGIILVDSQGRDTLWRWPDPSHIVSMVGHDYGQILVVGIKHKNGNIHYYLIER